ncbi:MAG: hypothetical protein ACJ762_01760 [Solirubrobacteraceae bacterium]
MDAQRLQILLASGSEADLESVGRGLAATGAAIDLHLARDCSESAAFLRQEGRFAGALAPDVILLDDALAGGGALPVLDIVRDTPELEHIQVVVILGDDADATHEAFAAHRIHDTVARPIDDETLLRVVGYLTEL